MLDDSEFDRWIKYSESTFKSANMDKSAEFYAWACFKFQQAVEYAAKAFLRGTGSPAYGHSISNLLHLAGFKSDIINHGKILDKFYIPTRYTDSWTEGNPDDYYTSSEAEEASELARSIIEEVRSRWKFLKEEEKKGKM